MDNVIPWSQIHPRIKSGTPFIGVVVIDPERELCISELVDLDPESLSGPEAAAGDLVGAAQQAAARVALAYRAARRPEAAIDGERLAAKSRLRVLRGNATF